MCIPQEAEVLPWPLQQWGGLWRAKPRLLKDTRNENSPGKVHKTQQLKENSVWRHPGIHDVTWACTQPPAVSGRAGLALHLGHIPDTSKQNSLVWETSLQHSQRARYKIQSQAPHLCWCGTQVWQELLGPRLPRQLFWCHEWKIYNPEVWELPFTPLTWGGLQEWPENKDLDKGKWKSNDNNT